MHLLCGYSNYDINSQEPGNARDAEHEPSKVHKRDMSSRTSWKGVGFASEAEAELDICERVYMQQWQRRRSILKHNPQMDNDSRGSNPFLHST